MDEDELIFNKELIKNIKYVNVVNILWKQYFLDIYEGD